MKQSIQSAFKLYKVLIVVYIVLFWMFTIIDDYNLIKTYWNSGQFSIMNVWVRYFLGYFVIGSVVYWIIVSIIIFISNLSKSRK